MDAILRIVSNILDGYGPNESSLHKATRYLVSVLWFIIVPLYLICFILLCLIIFPFLACYLIITLSPGWPRFWRLFSFILGHKTRDRVFEPAHQELLEDYYTARREFRTRPARAWLHVCFTVRTAMLVIGCLRGMIVEAGLGWLLKAVPSRFKTWWLG